MLEKKPIDGYTVIHALYGFLAKKSGYSYTQILIVATLYEILEPRIIARMKQGSNPLEWDHEGPTNITTDIVIALVGAYLGRS